MDRLRDIDYGQADAPARKSLQSIHTAPHVRMGNTPSQSAMVRPITVNQPTPEGDKLA